MRRNLLASIGISLLLGLATFAAAATNTHRFTWVDSWAASPDAPGPLLKTQTVRQIVRMSAGGTLLRIRLSNLFGTTPLTIGPVHVAQQASGADTVPGSDHALLFHGKPNVTIAKGESVLSDPVALTVKPLQALAVSIYVPANAVNSPSTIHSTGIATSYLTESGDATAAVQFPGKETNESRFLLTDVEVAGPSTQATLVAFGDSITDGFNSTADANERWPDFLAARLHADPALSSIAVANEGISGNRILRDNYGPSALSRFDRDALNKPHVRWIILLEGINDIGGSDQAMTAKDKLSPEQIIDGMKTLIARAHAKQVKIYGATLTPFGGAHWPYHTAAGEALRQAINQWIRTSHAFDGVIDFDQAIRDPYHPERMLAAYDSGDHLHPSDAGYEAMAKAIDLRLFANTP